MAETWAENSPYSQTSESLEELPTDAQHLTTKNDTRSRSSVCDKSKSTDTKALKRLAQNREAARKSRLRKKAYVQQLESSRLKLNQLEEEVDRVRHQGMYAIGDISSRSMNAGTTAFNMDYAHWVEEHIRKLSELRSALANSNVGDDELRTHVDNNVSHYDELFRFKGVALKSDVFHVVSGMWKTPTERCFMWMGGFRPSELLKMVGPQLEPLTKKQRETICSLQQSSQEAEDLLSQGMEALHQNLANTLAATSSLGTPSVANYMGQMAMAMGKLGTLENFVRQADNLRHHMLHQMHDILTPRQSAKGLVAMGDYFSRLRALSSLWVARPQD